MVKQMRDYMIDHSKDSTFEYFNLAYTNGNDWDKWVETYKPHNKKDYPLVIVVDT